MHIGQALVPHAEAAVACQPAQRALDDPPIWPQPLAAVAAPAGDPRGNAALATGRPTVRRIVSFVGMQPVGPLARPAQWPRDRLDGIEHGCEGSAVGAVGRAEAHAQRDAAALDQHLLLRARLAAIGRIRAGNFAPLFAGTVRLSRLARDQSSRSALPNRSSSVWCKRSHTPACCQARSRRQQVTPLPQPISWGSNSHGMPLWSTNKMPVSAARSGTRGRPPLGFGGSGGNKGSMTSHSSSLTSGLLMPRLHQVPDHVFRF